PSTNRETSWELLRKINAEVIKSSFLRGPKPNYVPHLFEKGYNAIMSLEAYGCYIKNFHKYE
ncbi:hypothetical protein QUA86_30490, partial [Microcoleus sp. F6_B6]